MRYYGYYTKYLKMKKEVVRMLPKGMIEIRLNMVRKERSRLEKEFREEPHTDQVKRLNAIKDMSIREHELMLILEETGKDEWLEPMRKHHIGKANRGELGTDLKEIFDRFIQEFGSDYSWYHLHLCSLLHIAGSQVVVKEKE